MSKKLQDFIFLESIIKMPLMELPVRSVYWRSTDRGVLFSPGSQLSQEQLKALPLVTDIVAPSLFHGGGVIKASGIYPKAQLWGPQGIAKRKPQVNWAKELLPTQWPWQEEFTLLPIEGMPHVNECVFVHKGSRTLIVADLCFNLTGYHNLGAKLILSAFGTLNRFGTSRFFTAQIKNKDLFLQSIKKLFTHDFDALIVSHGLNVESGAKELLQRSLAERGFKV